MSKSQPLTDLQVQDKTISPLIIDPLFSEEMLLVAEMRVVLGYGACSDQQTLNHTPLHTAALSGFTRAMKFLLDNGEEIDQPTLKGYTPLHTAAFSGHIGAMKFLLDNGAKIDQQTLDWNTPLSIAAHSGNIEAVKLLVQRGANINAILRGDINTIDIIFEQHKTSPVTIESIVKVLLESEHHSFEIKTEMQMNAVIKVLKDNHLLVPANVPLCKNVPDHRIEDAINANKESVIQTFNMTMVTTNMPEKGLTKMIMAYLENMPSDLLTQNFASAASVDLVPLGEVED